VRKSQDNRNVNVITVRNKTWITHHSYHLRIALQQMVARLCSSHCAIAMAVSVHNFCLAIANVLPLPMPWLFLHSPCWLIVALNIFNWQHHWVCSKSCRYAPSLCHGTIAITLLAGPVAAGWLLFSKKNHSMVERQEVQECCHHCAVTMMLSSLCHWPGTLLACLRLLAAGTAATGWLLGFFSTY